MRDQLYMLNPGFVDAGETWFCPGCAFVEGMLSFYPDLREQIDVHYLDYPRPRAELVSLLGEANQGCPVLVLASSSKLPAGVTTKSAGKLRFINDEREICNYLALSYGVGKPH